MQVSFFYQKYTYYFLNKVKGKESDMIQAINLSFILVSIRLNVKVGFWG